MRIKRAVKLFGLGAALGLVALLAAGSTDVCCDPRPLWAGGQLIAGGDYYATGGPAPTLVLTPTPTPTPTPFVPTTLTVYVAGYKKMVQKVGGILKEEGVKVIPIYELGELTKLIGERVIELGSLLLIDGEWWQEAAAVLGETLPIASRAGAAIGVIGGNPKVILEVVKLPKLAEMEEIRAWESASPEVPEKIIEVEPPPLVSLGVWTSEKISELVKEPVSVGFAKYGGGLKDAVLDALDWFYRTIENAYQLIEEAERGSPPRWGTPIWSWDWRYEVRPYGKLNVGGGWRKLMEDGTRAYDWYVIYFRVQSVPGYSLGWSEGRWWGKLEKFQTDYVINSADLNMITPSGYCYKYGPTTTIGFTTVSYNIGVTAGIDGAVVSLSYIETTPIPDYRVVDLSDKSLELVKWKQEYRYNSDSAKYPFLFKPGVNMRVSEGVIPWAYVYYEIQWKREYWWGRWSYRLRVWGYV